MSDQKTSEFEKRIYSILRSIRGVLHPNVSEFGGIVGRLICAADPYSLGITAISGGLTLFAKKVWSIYSNRKNWNDFKISVLGMEKTSKQVEKLLKDVFEWKPDVQRKIVENNDVNKGISSYFQDNGIDEVNASEISERVIERLGEFCLQTEELLFHLIRQEIGITHDLILSQILSKLRYPAGFLSMYDELDYKSYLTNLQSSDFDPRWFRRPHANWIDIVSGRVINREEEVQYILNHFEDSNIQLIVADSGAGKTTLGYLTGYYLLNNTNPQDSLYSVFYLDLGKAPDDVAIQIDELVRTFRDLSQEPHFENSRLLVIVDNIHLMLNIAEHIFTKYKDTIEIPSGDNMIDFLLLARTTTGNAIDSSISLLKTMGVATTEPVSQIRNILHQQKNFSNEFINLHILARENFEKVTNDIVETYLSVTKTEIDNDEKEKIRKFVLEKSGNSLWLVSFVLRAIERKRQKIGKVAFDDIEYNFCNELKSYYIGEEDEYFESTQIMKLQSVYERISPDPRFQRVASYLRSEKERKEALAHILHLLSVYYELELPIPEEFLNEIMTPEMIQPKRQPMKRISLSNANELVNTLKILLLERGEIVRLKRIKNGYITLPHITLAREISSCFHDIVDALSKEDISIVDRMTQLFEFHIVEGISINGLLELTILEPKLAKELQIIFLEAISNLEKSVQKGISSTLLRKILYLNTSEEAIRFFRQCTGVHFIGFGIPRGGFRNLNLNHDSKLLAAGAVDSGEIYILDTESGSYLDILSGLDDHPSNIVWHPNQAIVAGISDSGKRLCIWNLIENDVYRFPEISEDNMDEKYLSMSWSPQGDLMCIVSQHEIVVWDTISRMRLKVDEITDRRISDAFFKDAIHVWDGNEPFLIFKDRTSIHVYRNGKASQLLRNEDMRKKYPNKSPAQGIHYAWSSKYQKLAACSWAINKLVDFNVLRYNNMLSVWRFENGEFKSEGEWEINGEWHSYDLIWHPNGEEVVFVFRTDSKRYGINIWNFQKNTPPVFHWALRTDSYWMQWKDLKKPLYLLEGRRIVGCHPDGERRIFDVMSTRPILCDTNGNFVFYEKLQMISNTYELHYLKLDGKSESKQITLDPIDTSTSLLENRYFKGFHYNSNTVVLIGDSRAIIWDIDSETEIDSFEYSKITEDVVFRSVTYINREIHLLLISNNWNQLGLLRWKQTEIEDMRFAKRQYFKIQNNPNHSKIILGEVGPTYHIVDAKNPSYEVALPLGTEFCAFSSDNRYIALVRMDRTQKYWIFEIVSFDNSSESGYKTIFRKDIPHTELEKSTSIFEPTIVFSFDSKYVGISFENYQNGKRQGYNMYLWDLSTRKEILSFMDPYRLGPISWMDETHLACGIGQELVIFKIIDGDIRKIDALSNLGSIEQLEFTKRGLIVYSQTAFCFIPNHYGK